MVCRFHAGPDLSIHEKKGGKCKEVTGFEVHEVDRIQYIHRLW